MRKEKCSECYYYTLENVEGKGNGECRRNPPQLFISLVPNLIGQLETKMFNEHPRPNKDHWCGEWKKSE